MHESREQIEARPGYENDVLIQLHATVARANEERERRKTEKAKRKGRWRR